VTLCGIQAGRFRIQYDFSHYHPGPRMRAARLLAMPRQGPPPLSSLTIARK
jgi:hypothetical protein